MLTTAGKLATNHRSTGGCGYEIYIISSKAKLFTDARWRPLYGAVQLLGRPGAKPRRDSVRSNGSGGYYRGAGLVALQLLR